MLKESADCIVRPKNKKEYSPIIDLKYGEAGVAG